MLKIHQRQMEKLGELADDVFHRRLQAYFRENFPKETAKWDDPSLLTIITNSVGRARELGVESSDALIRYVGLAVLVDPNFDEDAAVRRFLHAPNVDPDYKVHMLSDMVIAKLRAS